VAFESSLMRLPFAMVIERTLKASAKRISLDPALLLESRLDLVGDFLGRRLGSALELAAAALLAVDFHPGADDESGDRRYWRPT